MSKSPTIGLLFSGDRRVVLRHGPVELNSGTAHFQLTYVWDETTQDFIVTEEVFHEGGPRDRDLTDEDVAALCVTSVDAGPVRDS